MSKETGPNPGPDEWREVKDPPDLVAMVAADKQEREASFGAAIETASKQFRCGLVAQTIVTGSQIESRVLIVAQD